MAGTFANGTIFKLGTNTVSENVSISMPNFSADDIDVTTHNNTTKFREFIKGLTDAGEITIEGNMNYTDYDIIYQSATTTSLYSATITLPTAPSNTQWLANVYCNSFESDSPHDDKIGFSAGFKITGKPTMQKV